jgi:hypothetical protein
MPYKNVKRITTADKLQTMSAQLRDRLDLTGHVVPVVTLDRKGETRRFKVLMPRRNENGTLSLDDVTYAVAAVTGLPVDADTHIIGIRAAGLNLVQYIAEELTNSLEYGMPLKHDAVN